MARVVWRVAAAALAALGPLGGWAQEALPEASPEEVGMSSERLSRLTETLQGCVEDGDLAGAVVLIARDGKVASSGQPDRSWGSGHKSEHL